MNSIAPSSGSGSFEQLREDGPSFCLGLDGQRANSLLLDPWLDNKDENVLGQDQSRFQNASFVEDLPYLDSISGSNAIEAHAPAVAFTATALNNTENASNGSFSRVFGGGTDIEPSFSFELPINRSIFAAYAEPYATSNLQNTFTDDASHALHSIQYQVGHQSYNSHTRPCCCSVSAMGLLEDMALRELRDENLCTDIVLKNLKDSLILMRTWLACKLCPAPRAMLMLIALIIDRLSIYLEKGVAHYMCKLKKFRQRDKGDSSRDGVVGDYPIESNNEWIRIMGVLLQVKSEEMSNIVSYLSAQSGVSEIIQLADRRLKIILGELGGWE
ncbi:hypothetical protein CMQ_3325 [Grosmannia clavigera kw1407]|uniref:Uncharacterized protein n=1 Tax=Grosmannia clavigera (strain kw1407 / UAMH 11150) TaxID=655863 RepID=F0XA26_GROCL|nr:uncharacterized protein CMQ_3325 [Grosmannia clavigera kw1407]EFX05256.1 hypothetical protein CMQ_3325 [Grosmannia clavigera kw1407]